MHKIIIICTWNIGLIACILSQEVSGDGAKAVASLLTARGVTFDFVLDEGLMVLNGVVPSHEKPVAMVGVVEKVGRHSAG